jgi:hypothetical protein
MDPNPLCGTLPGCVSVFTDAEEIDGNKFRSNLELI